MQCRPPQAPFFPVPRKKRGLSFGGIFDFRVPRKGRGSWLGTLAAMQVHFGPELLKPEWSRSVVCIGTFDGVHRGHQQVIGTAVDLARSREIPAMLVTFDRHPAAVLHPESCPKAISSLAGNIRIFDRLGLSLALILPFTEELSRTSAQRFYDEILEEKLRASHAVVGHDFAFGHGREGTPRWLEKRIETTVVPPFLLEGRRVSSSEIRAAIAAGDFATANFLLGRPWALAGIVVAGQKLGRELGYPTINLARSFDQATPADGIYAGLCETPNGEFRAAISVGVRPTVDGANRTIEAYLLDYPGESLYGAAVRLRFLQKLRDEERFDTLETLQRQIARDVEQVRAMEVR